MSCRTTRLTFIQNAVLNMLFYASEHFLIHHIITSIVTLVWKNFLNNTKTRQLVQPRLFKSQPPLSLFSVLFKFPLVSLSHFYLWLANMKGKKEVLTLLEKEMDRKSSPENRKFLGFPLSILPLINIHGRKGLTLLEKERDRWRSPEK